jgi:hypothetical protein
MIDHAHATAADPLLNLVGADTLAEPRVVSGSGRRESNLAQDGLGQEVGVDGFGLRQQPDDLAAQLGIAGAVLLDVSPPLGGWLLLRRLEEKPHAVIVLGCHLRLRAQLGSQPQASALPIRADRRLGDAEVVGDLPQRVAAKMIFIHNLALPRMKGAQLFEGLVQGEQVDPFPLVPVQSFIQGHAFPVAAMTRRRTLPGVIDQDLTQGPRDGSEKLGPVLRPVPDVVLHETEENLMHEVRGAQRMAGALMPKRPLGQFVEFHPE